MVAALVALGIFTPVFVVLAWFLVSDPEFRTIKTLSAALGGLGGVVILGKIAVTGTSTRFLEQPAEKAFGLESNAFQAGQSESNEDHK